MNERRPIGYLVVQLLYPRRGHRLYQVFLCRRMGRRKMRFQKEAHWIEMVIDVMTGEWIDWKHVKIVWEFLKI